MPWGRNNKPKSKPPFLAPPTKFDRLSETALIDCLEAEMRRTGELFRGFSHSELDKQWVAAEMVTHLQTALLATQALQRRVADLQSD